MNQQNVQVTQVVKNGGCLSGCFTVFAVLAVVGLAIEYWYVSLGVLVVAAVVGWLYWRQTQELPPAPEAQPLGAQAPAPMGVPASAETTTAADRATATCANCGAPGLGRKFCPECGAPQTKTCAGCGATGLTSPYCPECGSATYWPPVPN